MAGSFQEQIRRLQDDVGSGNLVMRCNVHQPYAAAQHNRMYYKHPHGGMANYLEAPFESEHGDMLIILAEAALHDIQSGAIDAVGKFDEWVSTFAPVEFDVLRDSVNLWVEDDHTEIYFRPQQAPFAYDKE